MKKGKVQKSETSNPKLATKKTIILKAQLKGVKGGFIVEDAVGI